MTIVTLLGENSTLDLNQFLTCSKPPAEWLSIVLVSLRQIATTTKLTKLHRLDNKSPDVNLPSCTDDNGLSLQGSFSKRPTQGH